MRRYHWQIILSVLMLILTPYIVVAEQPDLTLTSGIELNNYIAAATGMLALVLFILTLIAYTRTRNSRLIYVTAAFGLFAIKGFLIAIDVFIKSNWTDPLAYFLDFAILLCFFIGIIQK